MSLGCKELNRHSVWFCVALLLLHHHLFVDLCDISTHMFQGCFTVVRVSVRLIQCMYRNEYGWNQPWQIVRKAKSEHISCIIYWNKICTDGLVQDCSTSSALAMELLQSCTKPLTYIKFNICLLLWCNCLIQLYPCPFNNSSYIQSKYCICCGFESQQEHAAFHLIKSLLLQAHLSNSQQWVLLPANVGNSFDNRYKQNIFNCTLNPWS